MIKNTKNFFYKIIYFLYILQIKYNITYLI